MSPEPVQPKIFSARGPNRYLVQGIYDMQNIHFFKNSCELRSMHIPRAVMKLQTDIEISQMPFEESMYRFKIFFTVFKGGWHLDDADSSSQCSAEIKRVSLRP
jgi:hypothetical protein